MTTFLRFLFLIGYAIGVYFIHRYLRAHPPKFDGEFVFPESRPFKASWYMGLPLLWPLLALFWLNQPPTSPGLLIYLFIIVPPLVIFLPWLWYWGVRPPFVVLLFTALLLLVLPLLITATLFLIDGVRITIGVLPMLFFMLAPPAFMLLLVYLWGPQILPLSPEEQRAHRGDIAKLFAAFWTTFAKPSIVVVNAEAQTRVAGNPFLGIAPGLLVTEPENAVILRDGSKIAAIMDPGVHFVGYTSANLVHEVLDLFKQFRSEPKVEAITKDGIHIHVPISSIFSIGGVRPPEKPGESWRYHKSAAFKAFMAQEVNPTGRTPLDAHQVRSWKDIPLQTVIPYLKQRIAGYTLDELYGAKEPSSPKLLRIVLGQEMQTYTKAQTTRSGIEVSGGGMGNKVSPVDHKVVEQRMDAWKARKTHESLVRKGQIEATYLTQLGRVRSKMLEEILQQIKRHAQELENVPTEKRDSMLKMMSAVRLIETLDAIARDPAVEPLLPETVAQRMLALRKQREEGGKA